MSKDNMRYNTRIVHAGTEPDPLTGAVVPPIYQTSTFAFKDVSQGAARFAGEEEGYIYSRLGNPTVTNLEKKVAALESGEAALAFTTGMAAVSAGVMALVSGGDHVVTSAPLYGSTHGFFHSVLSRFGVETTSLDLTDPSALEGALRDNTRLIYFESPANPNLKLVDIEAVVKTARKHGIPTMIDNTFASPYLQRPLEMGVDVVLHSATKFIGGHGDTLGGLLVGTKEYIDEVRFTTLKDIGGMMDPFAAWLLTRGLKTLAVRVDQHVENAIEVAEFLEAHPLVEEVFYPGLKSFAQYELAQRQMKAPGALLAFEVKGGFEAGQRMMNSVELCHLAVSLGDVDTLIQHPASMTHSGVPEEERLAAGVTEGLVRLSVGIEDVQDIIDDLDQALQSAAGS